MPKVILMGGNRISKWFFLGILPGAAGILCGNLISFRRGPEGTGTSSPTVSRAKVQPLMAKAASRSGPAKSTPEVQKEEEPEPVSKRLENLSQNLRVEDLMEELKHLPSGKERQLAVGFLAKRWIGYDQQATLTWVESLTDEAEKKAAYTGMLKSWASIDSHSASAWLTNLPEGPLKWEAASGLIGTLQLRDPSSALSWAIAARGSEWGESNLESNVITLGRSDLEETTRIISASDLPDNLKAELGIKARASWNESMARLGRWNEILSGENPTP